MLKIINIELKQELNQKNEEYTKLHYKYKIE